MKNNEVRENILPHLRHRYKHLICSFANDVYFLISFYFCFKYWFFIFMYYHLVNYYNSGMFIQSGCFSERSTHTPTPWTTSSLKTTTLKYRSVCVCLCVCVLNELDQVQIQLVLIALISSRISRSNVILSWLLSPSCSYGIITSIWLWRLLPRSLCSCSISLPPKGTRFWPSESQTRDIPAHNCSQIYTKIWLSQLWSKRWNMHKHACFHSDMETWGGWLVSLSETCGTSSGRIRSVSFPGWWVPS